MTAPACTALARVLTAPPVDPGRDLAREWARRELSDPVYAKARPGLLQRLVEWVIERLQGIHVSSSLTDPRTGVVLLVVLVALVVTVVLLRTGRLRGPGRRAASETVFAGRPLDAEGYRARADEAAATGRWADAVRERFRAVVRSLEERAVLDERPGRTADEAAAEASAALPSLAGELAAGARLFDDVCYGDRTASAEHDRRLRDLDDAVRAARLELA
ncbi:MAG TPA: DUF4129 domain-containing protein [Angustibacter sp.]|nr:DUF4129 domain-containing protein [Angustibacter sp.]